jgi:hypothetical protein
MTTSGSDLVQRVSTALLRNKAYMALHDSKQHQPNGHEVIDEGKFRLGAYLTEFMGETRDPLNSAEERFANDRGTVGISDDALAVVGAGTVGSAIEKLEALEVGRRVAGGKPPFYMTLDVDALGHLKVDKSRYC